MAAAVPAMRPAEMRAPFDWPAAVQSLLTALIVALFAITFVVQAFQIPSESMEQTLLTGDYLLVDKLRYGGKFGGPFIPYEKVRRGDIIVFLYPVNPSQHFVKRVVGIPGDRVRLINRELYVNGTKVSEPYVQHVYPLHDVFRDEFPRLNVPSAELEARWWMEMQKLVQDGQLIVPEGNYFVLGDNRDDSKDSRYWGFVPRESVIGRPLIIYWSLRSVDADMPSSPSAGDRLFHFAYAVTHLFQITRWDRTLRVVK